MDLQFTPEEQEENDVALRRAVLRLWRTRMLRPTRLAVVDEDGVTFKSHLNGDRHRFTPEVSMRVQHELGADITFAFDELTTLFNTRQYQEASVARTQAWAQRCLAAHRELVRQRPHRPRCGRYAKR